MNSVNDEGSKINADDENNGVRCQTFICLLVRLFQRRCAKSSLIYPGSAKLKQSEYINV